MLCAELNVLSGSSTCLLSSVKAIPWSRVDPDCVHLSSNTCTRQRECAQTCCNQLMRGRNKETPLPSRQRSHHSTQVHTRRWFLATSPEQLRLPLAVSRTTG